MARLPHLQKWAAECGSRVTESTPGTVAGGTAPWGTGGNRGRGNGGSGKQWGTENAAGSPP